VRLHLVLILTLPNVSTSLLCFHFIACISTSLSSMISDDCVGSTWSAQCACAIIVRQDLYCYLHNILVMDFYCSLVMDFYCYLHNILVMDLYCSLAMVFYCYLHNDLIMDLINIDLIRIYFYYCDLISI
jgi:hypothetical protein